MLVDIAFDTSTLIDAARHALRLFVPVGKNELILYQEAYWANKSRRENDIEICGTEAFFDASNTEELEQISNSIKLDLPETATEYRAKESKDAFSAHIHSLIKSGCSESEAQRIAISHLTESAST